jgi:uncharacterized tellurite resistance protein B-like protein
MFETLKNIFTGKDISVDEIKEKSPFEKIQVATCVILLETACSDDEFSPKEKKSVVNILRKNFKLSREEVDNLIEFSETAREKSVDMWQFTHVINTHYSLEDKIKVVEQVWQIIYSDNKLNKYEDYLAHKLSKLLNLSHRDLIEAKEKALHAK